MEEAEWAIEVMKATGLPVSMSLNICSAGDFEGVSVEECAVRIAKAGKRLNSCFIFFLFLLDVLANVFSDTIVVPAKTCDTLFFVGVVVVFTRKIWMSFFALIPLVDSCHGLFPITTGNLFFYTYYTVKFGFVLLGKVWFCITRECSVLYYSGKFGFVLLEKVWFLGKFGFVLIGNVGFCITRGSSVFSYSGKSSFMLLLYAGQSPDRAHRLILYVTLLTNIRYDSP